eukprot:scaffold615_cov334-Prasinococcus_capsulatus_cf.AAC.2
MPRGASGADGRLARTRGSTSAWFGSYKISAIPNQARTLVTRRMSLQEDLELDMAYFMQAKYLVAGIARCRRTLPPWSVPA